MDSSLCVGKLSVGVDYLGKAAKVLGTVFEASGLTSRDLDLVPVDFSLDFGDLGTRVGYPSLALREPSSGPLGP